MATTLLSEDRGGAFLVELLHFAGWRLQIHDGDPPQIRATRADVTLEASGRTLAEAAGILFARAMRSGNRERKGAER
jgi:hypothetical protein